MGAPKGLGIYFGRVSRTWGAAEAKRHADRIVRTGAKHVGLCGEALDGWRARPPVLADCVEVFRDVGIDAHVYALPGRARAMLGATVGRELAELARMVHASGALLDAEEAYRFLRAQLDAARAALIDGANESLNVGFTTYGAPSPGSSFPWAAILGFGWLGWQCYETAHDRALVRQRLALLRETCGMDGVVPHVASYPRKSVVEGEGNDGPLRLLGDLRRVCLSDPSDWTSVDVPGAWVWSERGLDAQEVAALEQWTRTVGW